MPVKKKRDYRTGTIQLSEAKKKFDQYYKNNTKSNIGEFRGKIFDMLYQKKSQFTIKCNNTNKSKHIKNSRGIKETLKPGRCEKGSEKYLLPKGPKTFDIYGIDSFTEGSKFKVPGDSKNKTYTAKGYTLVKQIDKITKVVKKAAKLNKKNKKIYGPRVSTKGNDELYSSKFRKAYKARQGRFKEKDYKDTRFPSDTTSQLLNLVDARWNKYKRTKKITKKSSKKRKIKKKKVIRPKASTIIHIGFSNTEDMLELEDNGLSLSRKYTLIIDAKGKLIIKHNKTPLPESSLEYDNLNSFIKTIKLKVKRKIIDTIMDIDYLKIKLEKGDEDSGDAANDDSRGADEESKYDFILNIHTGHLLDIKKPNKKLFNSLTEFYKSKKSDYEITKSKQTDI